MTVKDPMTDVPVTAVGRRASGPGLPEDRVALSTAAVGGTAELREVLSRYCELIDAIDDAPLILWMAVSSSRLMRWIRFPAPRRVVKMLLVRHVHRCTAALQGATTRSAAIDGSPSAVNDLEMLQKFRESLPATIRMAIFWPLALLGVLGVAYWLADFYQADYSKLLGDLASSAVTLNRDATITALKTAHQLAQVNHTPATYLYTRAAVIVASSAALVIAPMLPSFTVCRRGLTRIASIERCAFTAMRAREVTEPELDLLTCALLLPAVAFSGVALILYPPTATQYPVVTEVLTWVFGGVFIAVAIRVGVELRARYRARRSGNSRRSSAVMNMAVGLAVVMSFGILVGPVKDRHVGGHPLLWDVRPGTTQWIEEVQFEVNAIRPHVSCDDPRRPLRQLQRQFLQFELETWSDVSQFIDPEIASDLTLRHWSIENEAHKTIQGNLYRFAKCSDGGDAISQPIVAGAHAWSVVVISAPEDAAFLRLDIPSHYMAWRWPIPPAHD